MNIMWQELVMARTVNVPSKNIKLQHWGRVSSNLDDLAELIFFRDGTPNYLVNTCQILTKAMGWLTEC